MKLFTISSDNLTSPFPSGAAKDLIEKNNNKITVENIFFITKHYQKSQEFTIRFIYFNYELF